MKFDIQGKRFSYRVHYRPKGGQHGDYVVAGQVFSNLAEVVAAAKALAEGKMFDARIVRVVEEIMADLPAHDPNEFAACGQPVTVVSGSVMICPLPNSPEWD